MLELQEASMTSQQQFSWGNIYMVRFSVKPSRAQFEAVIKGKMELLHSKQPQFSLLQSHYNKEREPSMRSQVNDGEVKEDLET